MDTIVGRIGFESGFIYTIASRSGVSVPKNGLFTIRVKSFDLNCKYEKDTICEDS